MIPIRRPLSALLAATLVVAACGDDDAETTPEPDGGGAGATSVTLLTHDSFDVSDEVLAAFTEDTGITVELLPSGDAGSMLNQAILTKGSPQGDVLFGVDSTFLSRALDEDLFVAYESPALEGVDESLVLDPEHRVTPIDTGDVCLNYDKAGLAAAGLEPPEDLADLADPAYAGTLVVENPATSSPGLAYLLATVAEFGEDGWQDHWRALRANDVEVAAGWEEAYYGSFSGAAGSPGDRPIVVSYASSPPAEVIFAEEPLDDAPTGVVDGSCYRQIEFAGILAGTEHEAAAQQLIDFLLSPTFQEDVPLNMFVYPVIDVELPAEFVEHGADPEDPYLLDADVVAANRDAWIEEWTEIVLR
ncbi:MAG TPA: thiamine ABC transporter substrate-binding protein [Acidimicrobiales bacterium]|nr:thiamine ABC transporter substrate-binding protein [Acidimicrobiales bacterium]